MPDYIEQQPFALAEFADNPEPRCPCLLLLDTSSSMSGRPIQELNAGIALLRDELQADSLASKRVELATITFGPVEVVQDFVEVGYLPVPEYRASGLTPFAGAVETGIQLLQQRKDVLRANGIQLFRPWIFAITDGEPTDHWGHLHSMIEEGERKGSFSFFAVGVSGSNMSVLRQISVREPLPLHGLRFKEFFLWLSASLKGVSRSQPGDRVGLPDYKPYGWSEV